MKMKMNDFPAEVHNTLSVYGLPDHELKLKEGSLSLLETPKVVNISAEGMEHGMIVLKMMDSRNIERSPCFYTKYTNDWQI